VYHAAFFKARRARADSQSIQVDQLPCERNRARKTTEEKFPEITHDNNLWRMHGLKPDKHT
jgi:hypothetical protein